MRHTSTAPGGAPNRGTGDWTYTYNLLPWSLAQVFTLDDATYGVLDSTTVLAY